MDVVLGIMRDVWATVFGLPDSSLDLVFNTLSTIFEWFAGFGASLGMVIDLFQFALA